MNEKFKIVCKKTVEHPWKGPESMSRRDAESAIAVMEMENVLDSTKGCPGPHEIVPAGI